MFNFLEIGGGGGLLHTLKLFPFIQYMTGRYNFLKTRTVFNAQVDRRNRSVLKTMFFFWIFYKFRGTICWSWLYTIRNATKMFRWLTPILIIRIRGGCVYTMSIFFTVTLFCRWMILAMLFSRIILGVTCYFLWTPIAFWIIIRSLMWLTVYKQTRIHLL